MKSKKARDYLLGATQVTAMLSPEDPGEIMLTLREAKRAVELAEQETEERMQAKAHRIIKGMMDGIFHGDMPQKIADDFIYKLNENETDEK